MKKILGLDLGTNSIGWAVVSIDETNEKPLKIEGLGSRIIPMDADEMGKYNKGNTVSRTANRTFFRGVRRLRERSLLRRERLHRVLNIIGFLPEHYANEIGWDRKNLKEFGTFVNDREPKLAWCNVNGKNEFLFMNSFQEMLSDINTYNPEKLADNKKVPLDWTIYYLRKKALTKKITKEELAWILLNFNQKRGYYQLRGEDEDVESKPVKMRQYFDKQIIKDIVDTGEVYKGLKILLVELSNGNKGKIFRYEIPQWIGLEKNVIVTVDVDSEGNDKLDVNGFLSQRFKIPSEDEWETEWKLIKMKTEKDLENSKKTVGAYIYDSLLENPSQKIKGKLVRTIERKYYKEELCRILEKQKEFHEELQNEELYNACIFELYPRNEAYRQNIEKRDFAYLFIDDILFYQRPLKSKKSLISDCAFEKRYFKKYDTQGKAEIVKVPLKCAAKSHPLFQEFRLWKFVSNLRIYEREKEVQGKLEFDIDVTSEFIRNEDDYVSLFEWLNKRRDIDQNVLLSSYFRVKKTKRNETHYPYRWNYVEDKKYPCNETRALVLSKLEEASISSEFLTKSIEEHLWHILYSVEDKHEIEKALARFAKKHQLDPVFVKIFKKYPPFKNEYGAFSIKALKKLLPLMRMGKYWDETLIDRNTKDRIEKILTAEYDENIDNKVREFVKGFTHITHFRALPEWLASYIVYGRFSEAKEIIKWKTVDELAEYIKKFRQHSMRNPIVEQIMLETLRLVRDIWEKEGKIEEIHIELGREMKNDKKEREKLSKRTTENENNNLRIKTMLMEFKNAEYQIDGVIPYSPTQQEILKIYEEYALSNVDKSDPEFDFVSKIAKMSEPTKSDILRYKLWLEQKYRSPYTGEIIPLSRLFTTDYEIEHIIPQSRYFDDSYSNKVICEAIVNKNPYKDNQLGYEFIKNHAGAIVPELSIKGRSVKIFTVEEYEKFVKEHYANLKSKMKKLLLDEIPDAFIERQLNDTRYISKEIKRILSNIVREEKENGSYEPEATSKNVISVTGGITSILKQDWGINDKWNELILPRFERLNILTNSTDYIATNKEGHKIPRVPFHLSKGFSTKRIDHRHHAMDAVVIACTTRNHVNYLNNQSAKDPKQRYDLKHLLCFKSRTDEKGNYRWVFHKPWESFAMDVKAALDEVVISYKQDLRIINKTTNFYQKFNEKGKKQFFKQEKGESWAIRKPMHKDTVHGEVNLRKEKELALNVVLKNPNRIVNKDLKRKIIQLQAQGYDVKKIKKYFEENKEIWQDINLSKIKVYYFTKETKDRYFATRKNILSIFTDEKGNLQKIEKILKAIESITDHGIQRILLRHLELKGNNEEKAFSQDGIEEMNRNLTALNGGKSHQPIYKVRVYEKADKFAVGVKVCKKDKFVEAAKGTNLFFAIYQEEIYDEIENKKEMKRTFASIPLNEVIERHKRGLSSAPEIDEHGNKLLFTLSPNEMVYVPTPEELKNGICVQGLDKRRVYKMVSCTGKRCFFIPANIANRIIDITELGINNKAERDWEDNSIKDVCVPLKIDRLGHINIIHP